MFMHSIRIILFIVATLRVEMFVLLHCCCREVDSQIQLWEENTLLLLKEYTVKYVTSDDEPYNFYSVSISYTFLSHLYFPFFFFLSSLCPSVFSSFVLLFSSFV